MNERNATISLIVGTIIGFMFGSFSTEDRHEKGLLRFCMTHSIPLEQCKIPEEGK